MTGAWWQKSDDLVERLSQSARTPFSHRQSIHLLVFFDASLMLQKGVPIRHACHVIANGPVKSDLADAFARCFADFVRMFEIKPKELLQQPHGACVGFVHALVVIKIFVEIIAQFQV